MLPVSSFRYPGGGGGMGLEWNPSRYWSISVINTGIRNWNWLFSGKDPICQPRLSTGDCPFEPKVINTSDSLILDATMSTRIHLPSLQMPEHSLPVVEPLLFACHMAFPATRNSNYYEAYPTCLVG